MTGDSESVATGDQIWVPYLPKQSCISHVSDMARPFFLLLDEWYPHFDT
jgi:hypothetical protein